MVELWLGDVSIGDALRSGAVTLTGRRAYVRSFPKWIGLSPLAGVGRPTGSAGVVAAT